LAVVTAELFPQPVVGTGGGEVDQPYMVAGDAAYGAAELLPVRPSRSRRWKALCVCTSDGVARRNSLRRVPHRGVIGDGLG